MHLTDAQIEHYARQIIVPGIGAAGQARLCAARVGLAGEPEGTEIAKSYLHALGCAIVPFGAPAQCTILAGVRGLGAALVGQSPRRGDPLVWYSLDDGAVTAGIVMPGAAPPDFEAMSSAAAGRAGLHGVAACDAVANAAALILGWDATEYRYHVELV
jgi:hypothetical protein